MGQRSLTRKGNYILKSNLPIGVQNMTLKSNLIHFTMQELFPYSTFKQKLFEVLFRFMAVGIAEMLVWLMCLLMSKSVWALFSN